MTVSPSSVFLVSGGGRGITASCAIKLAATYRCKFVLLGRSSIDAPEPAWAAGVTDDAELQRRCIDDLKARGEKPLPKTIQRVLKTIAAKRDIEGTLTAIQQAGGDAIYLSADITDAGAVQAAVTAATQRIGRITGIIHGAGNLADKRIENKTAEDFEYVYGAKIDGLRNLLTALPPRQLDHLVLFSSAAGFYGNIGQSDYAIANEILNRVAHAVKRDHPNCQVLSFNWGPWDAGMVDSSLKEIFAERQIDVIPVEVGTQILADELAYPNQHIQLIVGSPMGSAEVTLDQTLKTYRIHRRLTQAENPFLTDHTIGAHAVLPLVHAVAWLANACEDLYFGFKFFALEDFRVLKGIVFDETLADEYTLDITELEKDPINGILFKAVIWSMTPQGKQRYHYSGQVRIMRKAPAAPVYSKLDLTERSPLDGAGLYHDGTLFHGPAFRGVERVLHLTNIKLTMRCHPVRVSETAQGQFPIQTFNPFLGDIQFQSLVIWARKIHQAASLPLSAAGGQLYRAIPADKPFYVSMDVLSSSDTSLVADITTHDDTGTIYSIVNSASVTISPQLNALFLQGSKPT